MLDLRPQETSQGKHNGRHKGCQRSQFDGNTGKEIGARACQPDVGHNAPGYLLGRRQPEQGPVGRVEDGNLRVGQQWRAHEQVRIPEGQPPGAHRLAGKVAVGVKVGKDVQPGQDAVGQRDLPEKDQRQGGERRQGYGVRDDAAGCAHGSHSDG